MCKAHAATVSLVLLDIDFEDKDGFEISYFHSIAPSCHPAAGWTNLLHYKIHEIAHLKDTFFNV